MNKGMRTLPALLCVLALLTVAGNLQATDKLIIIRVAKMEPFLGPISNSELLIVKLGDQLKFKAIVDYVAPGYDPNTPGTQWGYRVNQRSPGTWATVIFGGHWSGPNTTFTIEYTDIFTVPALLHGQLVPANQKIVFELRRKQWMNTIGASDWILVATNSVKRAD